MDKTGPEEPGVVDHFTNLVEWTTKPKKSKFWYAKDWEWCKFNYFDLHSEYIYIFGWTIKSMDAYLLNSMIFGQMTNFKFPAAHFHPTPPHMHSCKSIMATGPQLWMMAFVQLFQVPIQFCHVIMCTKIPLVFGSIGLKLFKSLNFWVCN